MLSLPQSASNCLRNRLSFQFENWWQPGEWRSALTAPHPVKSAREVVQFAHSCCVSVKCRLKSFLVVSRCFPHGSVWSSPQFCPLQVSSKVSSADSFSVSWLLVVVSVGLPARFVRQNPANYGGQPVVPSGPEPKPVYIPPPAIVDVEVPFSDPNRPGYQPAPQAPAYSNNQPPTGYDNNRPPPPSNQVDIFPAPRETKVIGYYSYNEPPPASKWGKWWQWHFLKWNAPYYTVAGKKK